jgi:CubicO group peptidase (beta-lactamase class C family)
MLDLAPLEPAFAAANLPGAIALIVNRAGAVAARAFGLADVGTGLTMAVDTPCQIASMTKAVVSVAAMQLVEQGRLELDAPVGALLPELAEARVLTGFDPDGQPVTRPAARPITARHLLTHTSGLGYPFVQTEIARFVATTPPGRPGTRASLRLPLLCDPGEEWHYGVSTDWLGLLVEAVTGASLGDYLASALFTPLGMGKTGFHPALPPEAARVHMRTATGFKPRSIFIGGGEYQSGGGGLVGTAPDYGRFIRMILNGGTLDGRQVLRPETVAEMARDQVAPLRAGFMPSAQPEVAGDFDAMPGQHSGWGLGFLINPERGPHGRSPGSLAWAGIFNSYYWIDPAAGIGGLMLSQLSPFGDPGALALLGAVERLAYAS